MADFDSAMDERIHALLTPVKLPEMKVDLAAYRRLVALRARLAAEDPSILDEVNPRDHPTFGMHTAVYVAIMRGLRVLEDEASVEFDENTGKPKQ